jgi:hypothetical protein
MVSVSLPSLLQPTVLTNHKTHNTTGQLVNWSFGMVVGADWSSPLHAGMTAHVAFAAFQKSVVRNHHLKSWTSLHVLDWQDWLSRVGRLGWFDRLGRVGRLGWFDRLGRVGRVGWLGWNGRHE